MIEADRTHPEPGLSIDQAFLAVPSPGMFEQYPTWDRVVVFARVGAR